MICIHCTKLKMIVAYFIAQFNIWAMIAPAFIRLWSNPIFPLSILKTDIFCTPCGTRVLQFYVGFFVAKLQKSKRIFYCISPENVSSMKPVAPVVFRYCTSELAHAAAPSFQFEPATLGFGLVLFGCIFSVMHTHVRTSSHRSVSACRRKLYFAPLFFLPNSKRTGFEFVFSAFFL